MKMDIIKRIKAVEEQLKKQNLHYQPIVITCNNREDEEKVVAELRSKGYVGTIIVDDLDDLDQ